MLTDNYLWLQEEVDTLQKSRNTGVIESGDMPEERLMSTWWPDNWLMGDFFLNIFQKNPMTQMPMLLLLFFNTELLNDRQKLICDVTWPDAVLNFTEKG